MQAIEGVSSAVVIPSSMFSVSDGVGDLREKGRPVQYSDVRPLVSGGAFSPLCGTPSPISSSERMVEAVVGIVTAVIDLVVVALSHAKGGRESTSQRPQPLKPIGVIKPNPTCGNVQVRPPLTNTSGAIGHGSPKALQVVQDDSGVATVRTSDGYTVRAAGRGQGWSVTSPEGTTTHVEAGMEARDRDGGRWQGTGRSSFVFGANKVTVETKSLGGPSSMVSQMTIYNGQERVTIAGLNATRPMILALASDGNQHDDGVSDGVTFYRERTARGESWFMVQNGNKTLMGAK